MSGDLLVKVTLTADGSALVGAASVSSAALDKLQVSARGAAAGGDQMAFSISATTAALEGQTRAAEMSAAAIGASGEAKIAEVARLQALSQAAGGTVTSIGALSAAQAAYNATVNDARVLLASGTIDQAAYAQAVEAAAAKLALARAVHDAGSASMNAEAAAAAAVGDGLRGLGQEAEEGVPHITHAAMAMERMGAASGVGMMNMRVLTEAMRGLIALAGSAEGIAILGGAAFVGGVIATVAAEQTYETSIDNLDVTIKAHGNLLGLTQEQYLSLASQISTTAGVSDKAGRTIEGSFASVGISIKSQMDLAAALPGYAMAMGESTQKAAEDMASALADPAAAAKKLNDEFHLFSDAQLQQIDTLQRWGDKGAALELIAAAMKDHFRDLRDETNSWNQMLDHLGVWLDNHWDQLGQFIANGGLMRAAALSAGMVPTDLPASAWKPQTVQVTPRMDQTQIDALRDQAAALGRQYDPYGTQLQQLSSDKAAILSAQSKGVISAADAEKTLSDIETKRTQVLKAQRDAYLALNPEQKTHLELVQQLINRGPEVEAQAAQAAKGAIAQANAATKSSLAQQQLSDQLAIQKAVLPYVTAEHYAQGAALQKLKDIIDSVTKSMQDQQAAEHYSQTISDIKSQLQSLSGDVPVGALNDAFAVAKQDLDDWKEQSIANLDATKAGYADFVRYVNDVYNNKLAQLYLNDLANRKDWQSGVARQLDALNKSTADWATTSANLMSGLSQNFEDDFVKMAMTGKSTLGDFFTWIEEQLLRLAYQKFLAPAINSVFGDVVDVIGSAIGMPSGGATGGASLQTPGNIGSSFGGFHEGGLIGGTPTFTRYIHPAYFENAPRFHGGGLVAGERAIIARDDETIFTPRQLDTAGNIIEAALNRPIVIQQAADSTPKVNVQVHNYSNEPATKRERQNPDGSTDIDVIVGQIDNKLAERNQSGRSALTRSLESTHGISRSPV